MYGKTTDSYGNPNPEGMKWREEQLEALGIVSEGYPPIKSLGVDVLASTTLGDPGNAGLASSFVNIMRSPDFAGLMEWLDGVVPKDTDDPLAKLASSESRQGQFLALINDLDPTQLGPTVGALFANRQFQSSRRPTSTTTHIPTTCIRRWRP